jgi:hypothetical protein
VNPLRFAAALTLLVVAGCSHSTPPVSSPVSSPASAPTAPTVSVAPAGRYSKVMVIAEENHGYGQIIGDPDAPYINQLATGYGNATHMDAGYPAHCPSLAAYILLTSGTTDGICDDNSPGSHPLAGDNVFHQVAAAGREWRAYAESAPRPCATQNGGRYLVRHVPATYYLDDRADCARWAVPLGGPSGGALHDDVSAGTLPAFAFVTPDACDDMHGAGGCPGNLVGAGDRWLRTWLTQIMAGPDYRAGRLVVIITWDEGTGTDNHIPALVVAPTTVRIVSATAFTHCSVLRTAEELLRLPLLGCAAGAASMGPAFHLTSGG